MIRQIPCYLGGGDFFCLASQSSALQLRRTATQPLRSPSPYLEMVAQKWLPRNVKTPDIKSDRSLCNSSTLTRANAI
ncbi:MAG TPA: hypothetical protein V6D20_08395 [Candidatus Obscuribacterales bacterium]